MSSTSKGVGPDRAAALFSALVAAPAPSGPLGADAAGAADGSARPSGAPGDNAAGAINGSAFLEPTADSEPPSTSAAADAPRPSAGEAAAAAGAPRRSGGPGRAAVPSGTGASSTSASPGPEAARSPLPSTGTDDTSSPSTGNPSEAPSSSGTFGSLPGIGRGTCGSLPSIGRGTFGSLPGIGKGIVDNCHHSDVPAASKGILDTHLRDRLIHVGTLNVQPPGAEDGRVDVHLTEAHPDKQPAAGGAGGAGGGTHPRAARQRAGNGHAVAKSAECAHVAGQAGGRTRHAASMVTRVTPLDGARRRWRSRLDHGHGRYRRRWDHTAGQRRRRRLVDPNHPRLGRRDEPRGEPQPAEPPHLCPKRRPRKGVGVARHRKALQGAEDGAAERPRVGHPLHRRLGALEPHV
ncbi:hypothetical protein BU14_0608s0012 [Porphyra umbilicalis]|uniref:Uncharacterized protein n=1 Tax=Porphyra umbilicalis TaxID=2786 RepID=A0A1X6NR61_PORUM|nr:hypothetical protein BU14_0608s0012 [Porphyra umbilicalis]|eukprot:OSX71067.1 hypothetical protein BU14_0608s0012 [Porphyra umbilicalis]